MINKHTTNNYIDSVEELQRKPTIRTFSAQDTQSYQKKALQEADKQLL
jgi:hypothetical protein